MTITECKKCGLKYPESFGQCPKCEGRKPVTPLTTEEHIARMSDVQVEYVWQQIWWEQGNEKARALCLAEYDKRIGLENWPNYISQV